RFATPTHQHLQPVIEPTAQSAGDGRISHYDSRFGTSLRPRSRGDQSARRDYATLALCHVGPHPQEPYADSACTTLSRLCAGPRGAPSKSWIVQRWCFSGRELCRREAGSIGAARGISTLATLPSRLTSRKSRRMDGPVHVQVHERRPK